MPCCRHIVALAAVAAFVLPASASAGPLVTGAPDCSAQSSSQVSLPWADPASYVLAPGGAAESSDGWTLTGGAAIVSGSEPAAVHDAGDSHALRLPPGATATSATMCVSIQNPDLRFFSTAARGGRVGVETLFETASGDVASAPDRGRAVRAVGPDLADASGREPVGSAAGRLHPGAVPVHVRRMRADHHRRHLRRPLREPLIR